MGTFNLKYAYTQLPGQRIPDITVPYNIVLACDLIATIFYTLLMFICGLHLNLMF